MTKQQICAYVSISIITAIWRLNLNHKSNKKCQANRTGCFPCHPCDLKLGQGHQSRNERVKFNGSYYQFMLLSVSKIVLALASMKKSTMKVYFAVQVLL